MLATHLSRTLGSRFRFRCQDGHGRPRHLQRRIAEQDVRWRTDGDTRRQVGDGDPVPASSQKLGRDRDRHRGPRRGGAGGGAIPIGERAGPGENLLPVHLDRNRVEVEPLVVDPGQCQRGWTGGRHIQPNESGCPRVDAEIAIDRHPGAAKVESIARTIGALPDCRGDDRGGARRRGCGGTGLRGGGRGDGLPRRRGGRWRRGNRRVGRGRRWRRPGRDRSWRWCLRLGRGPSRRGRGGRAWSRRRRRLRDDDDSRGWCDRVIRGGPGSGRDRR
ncbi:MAG: hypothetical protein K0Q71_6340 [Thermomicrobiales bacterium]|nr:hypothetical protein [Thermomicrobiales bacterium]